MFLKKYVFILLLFVGNAVFAQPLDEVFRKFSACDAGFFKSLKAEASTFKDLASFELKGDYAWFKVANRKNDKENSLALASKPTIANLPVLSFIDESSDMESLGLFYYWGFTVEGKYDEVLEKIKPLVFENNRLRKDGDHSVRSELKIGNSAWRSVNLNSGNIPRRFVTERVFLVEPDTKPNIVKLLCSVQGTVDASVLNDLRPDIDPKDYPLRIQESHIHSVNLSNANIAIFKKAVEAAPYLTPKFKEINFTSLTKGRTDLVMDTKLVLNDSGLIDAYENMGVVKFQRQYFSNLVQTKYRFMGLGTSATIAMADEVAVEFPKTFNKNEKITYFSLLKDYPRTNDSKDSPQKAECTISDPIEAKTIHTNITGKAWFVSCIRDGDSNRKPEPFSKAFIEDLGIFIDYTPSKGLFGSPQPSYTKFEITR
jgi:hypothetical protein